ncbi:hypothetical protein J4E89_005330 [Alternaria sp. Ai002NY15]|nr:hypothetical protein J4E89_005330 [Alternaria sp. Ai002NY15]
MWAEVNGERKKVACGPCIRGHRSSKCDHRDRVLVEVRKPGRPLSSCPHPTGSCSCERVVINYTIPKASECACPSERAAPTATVAGNSRIQKGRRKSAAVTPYNLEKAIQAGFDAKTDASSITYTPSETSGSNAASLPSSASSTPRLLPAQNEPVSSCCKPKPVLSPVQEGGCCGSKAKPAPAPAQGGCCSSKAKAKPAPEPLVQKKSCCSTKQEDAPINDQSHSYQHMGHQFQFPAQAVIPQYQNFHAQIPSPAPNPFGLGTPIYNHAAAAYHRQNSISMSPSTNPPMSPSVASPHIGQHVPEHNCHCGESCSCFGCAAHPNNATMMEYVRIMAHFQYNGGFGGMPPPLYDMPTYPHQPGYGAEAGHNLNFGPMQQSLATPTPTQMSFQQSMDMATMPQVPMVLPRDWPQQLNPVPSQPQAQFSTSLGYTPSMSAPSDTLQNPTDTIGSPAASSPSDIKDEDTVTLSPSSYFWNEMTLPSCSDASGTCQCGDGCACVGCLTHGGHTGEPLDDPTPTTTAEHDSFLGFDPSLALNMNDPTDFLSFNPDPS